MNDEVLAELRRIREAVEHLAVPSGNQRWGSINDAARQYGVSVSFLRRCAQDTDYPPPCRKVRGKLLFDLHAMDFWLRGFPSAKERHADVVDELLREVLDGHETD
jgi:hypothetical protein